MRNFTAVALLAVLVAGHVGADPWLDAHPVATPGTLRLISDGWLLGDQEAENDNVLGRPATATAGWGQVFLDGDDPTIRVGIGVPAQDAELFLRLVGRNDQRSGSTSNLTLSERDTDADGFSDLLTSRQLAAPVGGSAADTRIGTRVGLRWPDWGLGLWVHYARSSQVPHGSTFAFPLTVVALDVTAETFQLVDLNTGGDLGSRAETIDLERTDKSLAYGLDVGGRFGAVGLNVGFGLLRRESIDVAGGTDDRVSSAGTSQQELDRNLRRTEDLIDVSIRLDGLHETDSGNSVLWASGVQLLFPRKTRWGGLEQLRFERSGGNGSATSEWVRTPDLSSATGLQVATVLGVGYRASGRIADYGVGLSGRLSHRSSELAYTDSIRLRIQDDGISGVDERVFTDLNGGGEWAIDDTRLEAEYTLGGGSRFRLTRNLGLLAGSRVGMRHIDHSMTQTLVQSQALTGTETIGDDVVNQVEAPYANVSVVDRVNLDDVQTITDLAIGLHYGIAGIDLASVARLDRDRNVSVLLETAWSW